MKSFNTITTIIALASCATAHVAMNQPVPFDPAPDTSPLNADGSNYPCKTTGKFTVHSQNTAAVGSKVHMAFTGTAVHNGGSCQISLTKDANPTANSQFKVIYSILGGCPGTDGATTTYDVPIPSDVPAGDYVFAWTWYNNIGNREIYQNCAPMTITGGSGTDDTFNALPDMAVYNVASKNTCKTVETFDVDFPNPGQYVLKGASFKPQAPTCDGTDLGTGSGGSGSSNSTSGTSGGSGGSGAAPSSTQSANNGQYTGIGAGSGSASSSTQTQVAAPTSATTSAAQSPAAVATPSAGGSNGTFSSPTPAAGSSSSSSCSPDGSMICSADGTQFALCNHGSAVFMPVAAGTSCVNGAIQKKRRDIAVKMPFLFSA